MVGAEISGGGTTSDGAAHASSRAQAHGGRGSLLPELAFGNWFGHFGCRDNCRTDHGLHAMEVIADIRQDADASAILPAYYRCHAVDRIYDALFGTRCDHGPRIRPHRRALSIFWNLAGLV